MASAMKAGKGYVDVSTVDAVTAQEVRRRPDRAIGLDSCFVGSALAGCSCTWLGLLLAALLLLRSHRPSPGAVSTSACFVAALLCAQPPSCTHRTCRWQQPCVRLAAPTWKLL